MAKKENINDVPAINPEDIIAQAKAEAQAIIAQAKAEAEKMLEQTETTPRSVEKSSVAKQNASLEEYVSVKLFKDSGKYKDDVILQVNGETCQIQRGVDVKIKRKFAIVLQQSLAQDEFAAMYIQELADDSERKLKEIE